MTRRHAYKALDADECARIADDAAEWWDIHLLHSLGVSDCAYGLIAGILELSVSQPLLEPTNSIQGYFPDRNWAIRIPAALLLAGFSVVGLFTSYVMYQERKKRRNAGVKRA